MIENPDFRIDKRMYTPAVYMWKREDEILYIGHSTKPIMRIGCHDVIDHMEDFQESDEILIWFYEDKETAQRFEEELLEKFVTKYNINGQENYGKAQALRSKMITMHNEGMSYRQIEAALGFKKSTVGKVIRGEGKRTLSRGPYTVKQNKQKRKQSRKQTLMEIDT
jgi:predicted GIY-YIG superfamily endonuclease